MMKNDCQKLVSTESTEKLENGSKNDEPKKDRRADASSTKI